MTELFRGSKAAPTSSYSARLQLVASKWRHWRSVLSVLLCHVSLFRAKEAEHFQVSQGLSPLLLACNLQ
jgi:hypothetical protein